MPTGMPFIGNTTSIATAVGKTAPNPKLISQYFDPESFSLKSPNGIPHSPPKNEREITCGTPSGATPDIFHGSDGNFPSKNKRAKAD